MSKGVPAPARARAELEAHAEGHSTALEIIRFAKSAVRVAGREVGQIRDRQLRDILSIKWSRYKPIRSSIAPDAVVGVRSYYGWVRDQAAQERSTSGIVPFPDG